MNVTYIKNNTATKYITFSRLLNPELHNDIGETWEDYLNNKWVKLNRTQLDFKKSHPDATVYEVFFMKENTNVPEDNLYTKEMTLEEVKSAKISEILEYDKSREVNVFYINGIPDWWDKDTRIGIFHRLDVESFNNKKETIIWFREGKVNMSIKRAYDFLYKLEDYAIKCLDNTNNHILFIKGLSDINSVNNFDYKRGYPEKIELKV